MSQVKRTYLKNEQGDVISPITSVSSVYDENGTNIGRIRYIDYKHRAGYFGNTSMWWRILQIPDKFCGTCYCYLYGTSGGEGDRDRYSVFSVNINFVNGSASLSENGKVCHSNDNGLTANARLVYLNKVCFLEITINKITNAEIDVISTGFQADKIVEDNSPGNIPSGYKNITISL